MGGETRTDIIDERSAFADGMADDLPVPGNGAGAAAPLITTAAPAVARSAARRRADDADHAVVGIGGRWSVLIERERVRGTGFHLVPALLCAGALVYFQLPQEPSPWLLAAALLCGLALLPLGAPAGMTRIALAGLVLLLIGMAAGKYETWRAGTGMLGAEISTRITGRVVDMEQRADGRVRLTLDVLTTERPALRHAPGRIRATARSVPADLQIGAVARGVVRLFPPSGPVRPQGYDFAFKSYFDGIGAGGFFLTGPDSVAAGEAGVFGEPPAVARLMRGMAKWRAGLAARIAGRIGGAEGHIAAALITGVRAGIPEEINEALRITGLYHIISISGLHMALVAGTVMLALRCGFALWPAFAMRRPVKKYAALAALAATGAYLVVSGSEVAAQRSFIMLAVMLVAVLFDRAALTMRNLAISAIIIILLSPHEVVGPSFQMSFAATAALVATYAAWSRFSESRRRTPRPASTSVSAGALAIGMRTATGYVGALALTSIVAGGATALFTAWHFQQVSPLGLVANLAVMPIVSVVVMPMAVLASVLMPFGLEGMALDLMGQGIAAMNAVAFRLAQHSAYDATGTIPLSAVLLITAALALLTLASGALRWSALPLVLAGLVLIARHELPDVLVAEDGRLVALRLADGGVAVNRARPNGFTMDNWMRALAANRVVRPRQPGPDEARVPGNGESGFLCEDGLCLARHHSGAAVAFAEDAAAAMRACAIATLIVIDDATARGVCRGTDTAVITKRDLARRGSAEIWFAPAPEAGGADRWQHHIQRLQGFMQMGLVQAPFAGGTNRDDATRIRPDIRFAVAEPYRAWHHHRLFSREARGLPPYRRSAPSKPTPQGSDQPQAAVQKIPATHAARNVAMGAGDESLRPRPTRPLHRLREAGQ